MTRIELPSDVAERMAAYLRSVPAATRTDHWRHYGALNHVRIEGSRAVVTAGAGFDSEYELNFRSLSAREAVGRLVRTVLGRNDLRRHAAAFASVWREPAGPATSPHQIIARNYMRLLDGQRADTYLEIGAGTGYLAELVRRAWRAKLIVIDLPEILPLGFLHLHSRFPDASFALPGEPAGRADMVFLTDGDKLPDDCADLAVNTASFGEMRPEVITAYFGLLRRVLRPGGLFFTVNREEKAMDGVPVRFREYPWLQEDQDLLYTPSALHAMVQPQNPMLVRLCRLAKRGTPVTSR